MTNSDIEASKRRLVMMRQAQSKQASPERIVLTEAFHEVETTLEELRVVAEELRQQNDELADARGAIESERLRYRRLFDFAPHGYVLTDELGLILEANRAASVMLNVEQKTLRRKPIAVFIGPGDKSLFYLALNELRSGEKQTTLEVCLTPRHGDSFDALFTAAAGPDSGGQSTLLWVFQDISERKRSAAKLAAFAAELEQRVEQRTMQLNAAYEYQRRIAEALQASAMPAVTLGDPTLESYAGYEAALDEAQVGGDFYDAFELDDSTALVVGDVSGKGLPAAIYTSQVRFVLRAFLSHGLDAARALTQLNDYIYAAQGRGDWSPNTFVAISLVIAAKESLQIQIFTAGIEPILIKPSGAFDIIPNQGMILGVSPGFQYEGVTHSLDSGDMLVLATDGFAEARCEGQFLGSEGVAKLVLAAAEAPDDLQALGKNVLSGVHDYTDGRLHDDICLLIARRK